MFVFVAQKVFKGKIAIFSKHEVTVKRSKDIGL